eukprot:4561223-Pleurochrysis_carterae.AAC.1
MPLRGLLLNQIRVQVSTRSTVITSRARFSFSTYDNDPTSKISNERARTGEAQTRLDTVYGALLFPTWPL